MDQKGEIEEQMMQDLERKKKRKDKTYVVTATVYVDNCENPEDATKRIEELNDDLREGFGLIGEGVQIRLPDSANELDSMDSHWEESGSSDETSAEHVRMRDLEGHGNLGGR